MVVPPCQGPDAVEFDGSEPVIGKLPDARRPHRLADVLEFEAHRDDFDRSPWRHVRAS